MADVTPEPTDALVERVQAPIKRHRERILDLTVGMPPVETSKYLAESTDALAALTELAERLKTAERERDAIGAALGEPCAECGHIDWRSDGYADRFLAAEAQRDEALAAAEQVPQLVEALEAYASGKHTDREGMKIARAALAKHRDPYGPIGHETC